MRCMPFSIVCPSPLCISIPSCMSLPPCILYCIMQNIPSPSDINRRQMIFFIIFAPTRWVTNLICLSVLTWLCVNPPRWFYCPLVVLFFWNRRQTLVNFLSLPPSNNSVLSLPLPLPLPSPAQTSHFIPPSISYSTFYNQGHLYICSRTQSEGGDKRTKKLTN